MKRWNIILLTVAATVALQSSAQQLILDGETIDLQPGSQIIIEEDGDVVVTSLAGDLKCGNVTAPPTVDVTVAPSNLNGPGNVTVSWDTQFADSCTPSGGNGTSWTSTNITLPSGQATFNVSSTTGFTLSCDNIIGTTQSSGTVTVSSNDEFGGFPPPSDCGPTEQPPTGTSREHPLEIVAGSGRVQVSNNFEGPFGEGWPGGQNSKEDIYISKNNYIAIGFVAGQAANCTVTGCGRTSGNIEWELSILPDAQKVVSISRCPGDFSTALGDCRSDRSPLKWTYGSGNNCVLQLGQQYYLNVIHGTSANPAVSTCQGNECGALINVR